MSDRHSGGEGEIPQVGCGMSERLLGGDGASAARTRGLTEDSLLSPVRDSSSFLSLYVLRTHTFL